MRSRVLAWAAVLGIAAAAFAEAQTTNPLTNYFTHAPALSPPVVSTDIVGVVRNSVLYRTPGSHPPEATAALYYAKEYGSCTWSSTTDVGACINLAIAAAVAAGGGTVVCPTGTYGLTAMVRAQASYIGLSCGEKSGTTLKWIGSSAGRMVSFDAPYGDTSKLRLEGNDIDVNLNGNALAADGLYLSSLFDYRVHLRASGQFDGGNVLNLDVVPAENGSTFGGAIDIQNGALWVNINVSGTSNQVRLGKYITGTGSHGNASFNTIHDLQIVASNAATGILSAGSDNNIFETARVFNAGTSIDLGFATSGSAHYASNGNEFRHLYYSGSLKARGTPTVAACTPYDGSSYNAAAVCTLANSIVRDITNSTPAPTIETGADLKDGTNAGYRSAMGFYGQASLRPGAIFTEAASIIGACETNGFTYGSLASAFICNTDGGPLAFFDDLAGDRWQFRFGAQSASARNLILGPTNGTGLLQFTPNVQFDNSAFPASYQGSNLGGGTLPFSSVYAKSHLLSNTNHTWALDFGLAAGTADANATLTYDGANLLTFGSDLSVSGKMTSGLGMALAPGSISLGSGGTGYAVGDSVTLACTGMTATTAPVVAVNTVSTGVVTGLTVTRAGVVTKVASPNCTFTQASTSGGGSGVTLTGSFAPIAGYLSSPTLSTGGGVANGNLFLGAETPALTMGGAENTFIGDRAGGAFTGAAGANTAVGHDAGGIFGGVAPTGSYNTFIGNDTGRNVSGTANANTAVGQAALANVSGDSNTAIGESAGSTITTGSANTILGYQVGSTTLVSGQSNVLIGTNNSIDTAAAGTSNTIKIGAGSTAIISSTGTGTPSTSATTVAGTLAIAGITTDATHTDATVCEDTTTHQLYAGSGTAGICLGTSSARFKLGIVPQTDGLAELLKLKPVNFHYRPGYGDGGGREQYGFVAEDVAKVMPKLVGLDVEGKPLNLDYMALVPVLVKAVQEQQREIEALKARIR